jgi:hypothetical protein
LEQFEQGKIRPGVYLSIQVIWARLAAFAGSFAFDAHAGPIVFSE